MGQAWTKEDVQMIIEAARGKKVDDTTIPLMTYSTIKAADAACTNATACTDAEKTANLAKRKTAIQTNRFPDMFLRIQLAIQQHIIDYPLQTAEKVLDSAFIRIGDSTKVVITTSFAASVVSNIFNYGITLNDIVSNHIIKTGLVEVLNEADSLCAPKDQALDAAKF